MDSPAHNVTNRLKDLRNRAVLHFARIPPRSGAAPSDVLARSRVSLNLPENPFPSSPYAMCRKLFLPQMRTNIFHR